MLDTGRIVHETFIQIPKDSIKTRARAVAHLATLTLDHRYSGIHGAMRYRLLRIPKIPKSQYVITQKANKFRDDPMWHKCLVV